MFRLCFPLKGSRAGSPAKLHLTWHDAHLSLHLVQLGGILRHLPVVQQGMQGKKGSKWLR